MSEKEIEGFRPEYQDDDGILVVKMYEGGEVIDSKVFVFEDFIESSVFAHWQLQALFTTLCARSSCYKGKDKLDHMSMTYDLWCEGTWRAAKQGGTRLLRIEVEAIAKVKGCDIAKAGKAWSALPPKQQAELVKNPLIAKAILEIRAVRESSEELELDDLIEL